jgi:hypothetical protein
MMEADSVSRTLDITVIPKLHCIKEQVKNNSTLVATLTSDSSLGRLSRCRVLLVEVKMWERRTSKRTDRRLQVLMTPIWTRSLRRHGRAPNSSEIQSLSFGEILCPVMCVSDLQHLKC